MTPCAFTRLQVSRCFVAKLHSPVLLEGCLASPKVLLLACAHVRRGVLRSYHDEIGARSHKRPQRPTRHARDVRGGKPSRPHRQPHREEAEAAHSRMRLDSAPNSALTPPKASIPTT